MSEDQLGLYPDLRTLAASVDTLGARLALGKADKQGQPSTPAPCKTSRARGGAALAAADGKPPKLAPVSHPLASDIAAAVKTFADALARSSRRATSLCVPPFSRFHAAPLVFFLLAPVSFHSPACRQLKDLQRLGSVVAVTYPAQQGTC